MPQGDVLRDKRQRVFEQMAKTSTLWIEPELFTTLAIQSVSLLGHDPAKVMAADASAPPPSTRVLTGQGWVKSQSLGLGQLKSVDTRKRPLSTGSPSTLIPPGLTCGCPGWDGTGAVMRTCGKRLSE